MLISQPPNNPVDDGVSLNQGWSTWFNSAFNLLVSLTQSGTTAQRPTKLLFIGKTYFDTTIGRPIWYNGTNWIKADGTVV